MDNNTKALSYYAGVLVSFIGAALFHYVFHWAEGVFITIFALTNLYCLAAPQSIDHYAPTGLRFAVGIIALVGAGVFGLLFMSWTLLAIYLVATIAASIIAIVRS